MRMVIAQLGDPHLPQVIARPEQSQQLIVRPAALLQELLARPAAVLLTSR